MLRGWLLRLWIARKAARFSRFYTEELLKKSKLVASRANQDLPAKLRLPPGKFSRIVFIADVLWEDLYLVPELEKICSVTTLNLGPALKSFPRHQAAFATCSSVRKFISVFHESEPSIVLLYLRPALMSEEVFEILRRRFKCPLVGLNLDDQSEFSDFISFSNTPNSYNRWAALFDVNLTSSRKTMDWYHALDLAVYYMPEGFRRFEEMNPPDSVDSFAYELSFLGAAKLERVQLVVELRSRGVPIQCFGSGWEQSEWVKEPNAIFRKSMLNLGIGTSFPLSRLTSLKARDFECPGVGGCYLTQYNWELAEHYVLGREILCYSSIEELIEIYSYYRSRPEACLQIAQAAWARGVACHTWEKRFRDFLAWLSK